MKSSIFILILFFVANSFAQNYIMKIKLNNGTTDTIKVVNINKIKFKPDPASKINNENLVGPDKFELYSNYPNPFNPSTTIEFSIPETGLVQMNIYDIQGKRIRSYERNAQQAGRQHFEWDGKNTNGEVVSSGIYLYTLKFNEQIRSGSMVFLK